MKGSERQETIFHAWAEAVSAVAQNLDVESALNFIRESVRDAEGSLKMTLQEMDKRPLSDPEKARFVGTVVSNLHRRISEKHKVKSSGSLQKILIEVYQKFPDHSG